MPSSSTSTTTDSTTTITTTCPLSTTTTTNSTKTTSKTCVQISAVKSTKLTTTTNNRLLRGALKSPDGASTSSSSNSSNIFSDSSLGGSLLFCPESTSTITTNVGGGILQIMPNNSIDLPTTCGFILSSGVGTADSTQIGQQNNTKNCNNIINDNNGSAATFLQTVLRNSADSTNTTNLGDGKSSSTTTNFILGRSFPTVADNNNRFALLHDEENHLIRSGFVDSSGEGEEDLTTTLKSIGSGGSMLMSEDQLKAVRDYLTSASTSAEVPLHLNTQQQLNGVEGDSLKTDEIHRTTIEIKNFQSHMEQQQITTLKCQQQNIRYGPNHVFTSRSFIRAGFDGSLKYQVWAGISFLGKF